MTMRIIRQGETNMLIYLGSTNIYVRSVNRTAKRVQSVQKLSFLKNNYKCGPCFMCDQGRNWVILRGGAQVYL